eukprot:m.1240966 g.1240966  ORF g.1240966 m.1240966 type:complete len:638 (+) comp24673_c3_seq1:246-2159(+)
MAAGKMRSRRAQSHTTPVPPVHDSAKTAPETSAGGAWIAVTLGVLLLGVRWSGVLHSNLADKNPPKEHDKFSAVDLQEAGRELQQAAVRVDFHTMERILNKIPASVNYVDNRGSTLLASLMEVRHHNIMTATVRGSLGPDYEAAADVIMNHPAFNASNECPIYYALQLRNLHVLRALTTEKHRVAVYNCMGETDAYNETMLHIAARSKASGFTRVFEIIRRKQSLQHTKKVQSYPVLDFLGLRPARNLTLVAMTDAISTQDLEVLLPFATPEMLNARGWLGHTPLHVAAMTGNRAAVRLLARAGADMDAVNSLGETPLHAAASAGFSHVVAELLDAGAAATVTDASGRVHQQVSPSQELLAASHVHDAEEHDDDATGKSTHRSDGYGSDDRAGGWDMAHGAAQQLTVGPSECQIPSVEASEISDEEILTRFVHRRIPVRIVGYGHGWPARRRWRRKSFLQLYGKVALQSAPVPYGDLYGFSPTTTVAASEFIETVMGPVPRRDSRPNYVFDSRVLWTNGKLQQDVTLGFLNSTNIILRQFILGPNGSGAYPHYHNAAANALVYGHKHWFLFPPSTAFFNLTHIRQWTTDGLPQFEDPSSSMLRCAQQSGDVVVIPDNWGHAVLNEQDSIAVAIEFHL